MLTKEQLEYFVNPDAPKVNEPIEDPEEIALSHIEALERIEQLEQEIKRLKTVL